MKFLTEIAPEEPALPALFYSFPDVQTLLPITALVAIGIFLAREVLEWRRRSAADARKVKALKRVLARECELNQWSIGELSDTLKAMRDIGVTDDASRVSMSPHPGGGYTVQLEDGTGGQGGVLTRIYREALMKHLVDVAALDEGLYATCESALDSLSTADHVYQSLVHGPTKIFPSTPENYYSGLIDYGLTELELATVKLKALYFACTGTELTRGKIR